MINIKSQNLIIQKLQQVHNFVKNTNFVKEVKEIAASKHPKLLTMAVNISAVQIDA